MLRRLYMCLVALLLAPLACVAQVRAADILILSSHSKSSEWQQLMTKPIESLAQTRPDWEIVTEDFGFV